MPVDVVLPESLLGRTVLTVLEAARRMAELTAPASRPGAEVSDGLVDRVLADHLERLPPGASLAGALDRLEVDRLGVDALVETVAAWERVRAWATAGQAAAVAALSALEHHHGRGEFVTDALATRLHVSGRAAQRHVDLAAQLSTYPPIADALRCGAIDARKAEALATELDAAPAEVAAVVLDSVLPQAGDLTAPTLARRARRAAFTLVPTLAAERAAAEADRRGIRLTPAPDTMAHLTLYLPADDAMTCLTALDALADAAHTPDDPRTADARRVDALTDLLRAVLESGTTPAGADLPVRQRRRPHIEVTVAATTLLGLDDHPGDLTGYGPIPADLARRIAADGTWRRILIDSDTGDVIRRSATTYRPGADLTGTVTAREPTCTFPGCRVPATRCDLDHLRPYRHDHPPAEQTTAANLHPLCRHHHRLKTHTTWQVERDPASGLTTWTTPWGRTYPRTPDPRPGTDHPHPRPARPSTADPQAPPPS